MQIITETKLVAPWVIDRLPELSRRSCAYRIDAFTGIGYTDAGRMVVGVLFSDHSPIFRKADVHVAVEPGSNGFILRPAFSHAMVYAFDQLKCVRVTANVPKRHDKARKLVTTLGFTEEGCMKHGFLTDDLIIYGLTKRNAEKWILRGR